MGRPCRQFKRLISDMFSISAIIRVDASISSNRSPLDSLHHEEVCRYCTYLMTFDDLHSICRTDLFAHVVPDTVQLVR